MNKLSRCVMVSALLAVIMLILFLLVGGAGREELAFRSKADTSQRAATALQDEAARFVQDPALVYTLLGKAKAAEDDARNYNARADIETRARFRNQSLFFNLATLFGILAAAFGLTRYLIPHPPGPTPDTSTP